MQVRILKGLICLKFSVILRMDEELKEGKTSYTCFFDLRSSSYKLRSIYCSYYRICLLDLYFWVTEADEIYQEVVKNGKGRLLELSVNWLCFVHLSRSWGFITS